MQRCVPTCWERKLKLGCLGFNSSEHVVVEVLVHIRLFDWQLVILKAVLVIVVNVVRCNSCGFCALWLLWSSCMLCLSDSFIEHTQPSMRVAGLIRLSCARYVLISSFLFSFDVFWPYMLQFEKWSSLTFLSAKVHQNCNVNNFGKN